VEKMWKNFSQNCEKSVEKMLITCENKSYLIENKNKKKLTGFNNLF